MSHEAVRLLFQPGPRITVETFQPPEPVGAQVRVRVTTSAVSAGSEMNFLRHGPQAYGIRPVEGAVGYPIGYMAVGVVDALGPAASGVRIGQRVLCGASHTSAWIADPALPSGFLDPVPDGVSDGAACYAVLGDVALHGVRRAALQIDGGVAVFGLGMVGQLTLQLARLSGAYPLIAVDLDDARLELARAAGATHTVNPGREDAVAAVRAITGGAGVETAFHCAAVAALLQQLLEVCADRGRVVLTGSPPGQASIRLQDELLRREITLTGVYETGIATGHPYWPWTRARNRRACLRLMAEGALRIDGLISHRVPYSEALPLYEMLLRGSQGWMGVTLSYDR